MTTDVISNSDHKTLNTNTPTRVPSATPQQTSSPDITPVSNTFYNRTSWTTQQPLTSDHLTIITTINIRHDYRLQQKRRTFTNYKIADWTQFTEGTESAFAQTTKPPTYTLPTYQTIHKHCQAHNKQDTLTEQHTYYKDITSHSLQLRSKRQYNKVKTTTHTVLTN